MAKTYRTRRIAVVGIILAGLSGAIIANPASYEKLLNTVEANAEQAIQSDNTASTTSTNLDPDAPLARDILSKLETKGRAPKTGYTREEFYSGWPKINGCSLRQIILKRELDESAELDDDKCTVLSGKFVEPYTGEEKQFQEKSEISKGLQIDHVVALSDAWQKGAQNISSDQRYQLATDPLNLLAVDSSTNQGKSDGDAATWLPPNKAFRCEYVARQVSVKYKYGLWVTSAERDAIEKVLEACPNEPAVGIELKSES